MTFASPAVTGPSVTTWPPAVLRGRLVDTQCSRGDIVTCRALSEQPTRPRLLLIDFYSFIFMQQPSWHFSFWLFMSSFSTDFYFIILYRFLFLHSLPIFSSFSTDFYFRVHYWFLFLRSLPNFFLISAFTTYFFFILNRFLFLYSLIINFSSSISILY